MEANIVTAPYRSRISKVIRTRCIVRRAIVYGRGIDQKFVISSSSSTDIADKRIAASNRMIRETDCDILRRGRWQIGQIDTCLYRVGPIRQRNLGGNNYVGVVC